MSKAEELRKIAIEFNTLCENKAVEKIIFELLVQAEQEARKGKFEITVWSDHFNWDKIYIEKAVKLLEKEDFKISLTPSANVFYIKIDWHEGSILT